MKIHNIRMGYATNSSSSHSIIVMAHPPADEAPEDDEFGWSNFTLSSREARSRTWRASSISRSTCLTGWRLRLCATRLGIPKRRWVHRSRVRVEPA